jgi:hypothetical protein
MTLETALALPPGTELYEVVFTRTSHRVRVATTEPQTDTDTLAVRLPPEDRPDPTEEVYHLGPGVVAGLFRSRRAALTDAAADLGSRLSCVLAELASLPETP